MKKIFLAMIAAFAAISVGLTSCDLDEPVKVTSITVNMTSVALKVGQGIDLDARVYPTTSQIQSVTWSSKNPNVAVVDPNLGIVTAVAPGQTYIQVLALDGSGTTATVPVKVSPNDLTILTEDVPADLPASFGFKLDKDSKITIINADGNVVTTTFSQSGNLLQAGAIAVYPSNAKVEKKVVDMAGQSGSLEDFQSQYAIMVAQAGSSLQPMVSVLKVVNNRKAAVTVVTSSAITTRAADAKRYYKSLNVVEGWQTSPEPVGLCTIQPGDSAYVAAPVGNNINVETEDGEVVLTIPTCKAGTEYPVVIEENNIPVEKIEITNDATCVIKGQTLQLTTAIAPADATNQVLNWTSSDTDIATVDEEGLVRGVSVGEVTITATAADGSEVAASVRITVEPILVEGITLTGVPASVTRGDTFTIKAAIKPADADNQKLVWVSSDERVATVDQHGHVTALAVGSVIITAKATDESGLTTSVPVTVKPVLVTGIELSEVPEFVQIAETYTIKATVRPADAENQKVNWKSSDETVATIDQNGKITALAVGEVTIYATTDDDPQILVSTNFFVIPIQVSDIKFVDAPESLVMGETCTLKTVVMPADAENQKLAWESSDETIATVKDGVVTALAVGSVIITAKATDGSGIIASTKIIVKPVLVSEIKLTGAPASLMAGESCTLKATALPDNATNKEVIWTSSDKKIATVDEKTGKVTAVAKGTVTITAKATDESGVTASVTIEVKPKTTTEQLGEGVNIFN